MTHIVTEACIKCKYTDCVDVCPVDCFREGPNFLTIDPDECIDCAVCIPECPVNAIYAEEDAPADQMHMVALNAELARLLVRPDFREKVLGLGAEPVAGVALEKYSALMREEIDSYAAIIKVANIKPE